MRGLPVELRDQHPSPHPSPAQVGLARLARNSRRDPGKPGARGRGSRPSQPHPRRPRDRGVWAARSFAHRCAAARCEMGADRRPGGAGRLALPRTARVSALAKLSHAADGGTAGAIHARELPHRLFEQRQRAPFLQFPAILDRRGPALARGRHRARLDERTHQYAVQDSVLRPCDHPLGDSRHSLHGFVDSTGEPENRPDQSRPAETVRHGRRVRQRLHHGGDDLGRWAALLACGFSADDGRVPFHGSRARRASRHERSFGAADRAAGHVAAGLAGGARGAPDPVRACD